LYLDLNNKAVEQAAFAVGHQQDEDILEDENHQVAFADASVRAHQDGHQQSHRQENHDAPL